jgi:hypothetical protein
MFRVFTNLRLPLLLTTLATLSGVASTARAGLLTGKEMALTIACPTTDSVQYSFPSFVVGDRIELAPPRQAGFADFNQDISGDLITFNLPQAELYLMADFNDYVLTDLSDAIAPFASLS